MDRIQGELFRFDCPFFADELIGREAFEGLEPSPEVGEELAQLVVVIIVEAFDGRVLDRAVPLPGSGLPANRERDPLNLAVRPGVLDLGQPVVDLMLAADPIKDVLEGVNVPVVIGELDAIIRCPAMVCVQTMRLGEHDVDPAGHGRDQVA